MEENNDKKFTMKDFSEFVHTPRGKAVIFFGIYFVFFLALIILARVSGSGPVLGSTDLQLDSYSANFSAVSNGNYNFNYQFVVDGVTSTYTGSHYEKKALFTDGVVNYYQDNDLYMKEQAGLWIKCDVPYPFSDFVDVEIMKNLVDHATYISKTELASGESTVNFSISTTTLIDLLEGVEVDLDDPVNTIVIQMNEDRDVVGVSYDISSYAKYKGLATGQVQLTLSYSDFGEVAEIQDVS